MRYALYIGLMVALLLTSCCQDEDVAVVLIDEVESLTMAWGQDLFAPVIKSAGTETETTLSYIIITNETSTTNNFGFSYEKVHNMGADAEPILLIMSDKTKSDDNLACNNIRTK